MEMKYHKNHYGFTLVELLVVCAIIAILVAVIIPSINQSRARGRDAQVRAQVQTIKLALARAAAANVSETYPGTVGTWYCLTTTTGACSNSSLNANESNTLNTQLLPYFPGNVYPQAQGAVSGQYRYNAYVYNPYDAGIKIPGYNGPILLWWQEKTIQPADCNGTIFVGTGVDAGLNYCYERLAQ